MVFWEKRIGSPSIVTKGIHRIFKRTALALVGEPNLCVASMIPYLGLAHHKKRNDRADVQYNHTYYFQTYAVHHWSAFHSWLEDNNTDDDKAMNNKSQVSKFRITAMIQQEILELSTLLITPQMNYSCYCYDYVNDFSRTIAWATAAEPKKRMPVYIRYRKSPSHLC